MRKIIFLILSIISATSFSQERNWVLNGYVKDLQMYYSPKQELAGTDIDQLNTNIIHNRLNFKWYANDKITVVAEMRNRLIFGNIIREFPDYQSTIDYDNGWADLSWVSIDAKNWFLHSMVDRAYIDYSHGKWQFRVGRQRINWGVNLVWNPNDVFNTFSYFDFDYEERPGTDAMKIQYYTGATSSAELVFKMADDRQDVALVGLYRFSRWKYDFQVLSGRVGDDYIIGGGWSGDIKGGGFRGEITHFIPHNHAENPVEATVASISGDYTLKNSLYLHAGALFNSHGTTGKAGGMDLLFNPDMSAKYLSFAKYELFGQISYPFTPLLNGSFSGIINPCDHSFYVGPAFTYSLQDNLELMLTGQLFFGDEETEFGDIGQLAFARIRWSF
ncbi:MAG: hypothetical protein RBS73_10730 [Prolixibacteraceae bacterium]|jgi:hypothetical protein|nr:hypothetical protein [Prolixibacteraceae bacterium]